MKSTLSYSEQISDLCNKYFKYSFDLERENAKLRTVIRILAKSRSFNEDGQVVMSLTSDEAEFIMKTCEECNVFGEMLNWEEK